MATTTIRDVMTRDPVCCAPDTTVAQAARLMASHDIGDVLVADRDRVLSGIVTDRDLVVRCLADGANPQDPIRAACSSEVHTLEADASIDDAVRLMSEHSLRRVPVVEEGRAIGIVSIGDLARERDPDSALGRISAASPNE